MRFVCIDFFSGLSVSDDKVVIPFLVGEVGGGDLQDGNLCSAFC